MNTHIVITLTSVKKGRTANWIVFKAICGWLNNNYTYTLEFCGNDLNHSLALNDDVIKKLIQKIASDFGHAPYDIDECKRILNSGITYTL